MVVPVAVCHVHVMCCDVMRCDVMSTLCVHRHLDDPDDSITIEFGLYDPVPADYWIVKQLMARYVDEAKKSDDRDALVVAGESEKVRTLKL